MDIKGLKMKYFVLKPEGDDDYAFASRMAMIAYASQIKRKNPQLAKDLNSWVNKETSNNTIIKE